MLEKIWKPDTYFHNGLDSYLHTITRHLLEWLNHPPDHSSRVEYSKKRSTDFLAIPIKIWECRKTNLITVGPFRR
jgi:hypothetical protein